MKEQPYTCPACGTELELYANGDNDAADDRWTCDKCLIEYPRLRFPLPTGYVRAARLAERAEQMERERRAIAAWNQWASQGNKSAQ